MSYLTINFVPENDLRKIISTLLNPKTQLIKKRQLMRSYCGDYRDKMAKQDKKIKEGMFFCFLH